MTGAPPTQNIHPCPTIYYLWIYWSPLLHHTFKGYQWLINSVLCNPIRSWIPLKRDISVLGDTPNYDKMHNHPPHPMRPIDHLVWRRLVCSLFEKWCMACQTNHSRPQSQSHPLQYPSESIHQVPLADWVHAVNIYQLEDQHVTVFWCLFGFGCDQYI